VQLEIRRNPGLCLFNGCCAIVTFPGHKFRLNLNRNAGLLTTKAWSFTAVNFDFSNIDGLTPRIALYRLDWRILDVTVMSMVARPATSSDEAPAYGPELEGFSYPWPVLNFEFVGQGIPLHMAYMDVKPTTPNGRVVILLHGKNYVAATWEGTIAVLSAAGYRVIAPDQIGFGKSTKPAHYQYTFQQLAGNTHALLASLGISRVTVVGHSTGGMLGVRYALMYPDQVDRLALVDPIGLEDWKAKGVPWQSVDALYQQELQTTADRIREYERTTYYAGTWQPEYERWVQMLAGLYRGPGRELVAWNAALLSDMICTQPVLYEFGDLRMPVLLVIGDKDTTAFGKDVAPPAVRATLGNYPKLGKEAASRIPHVRLVEFPDLGHSPQIQAPEVFHPALLDWLGEKLPDKTG
jgi:pimeloyl-ACP methyl ester carboxylesterase